MAKYHINAATGEPGLCKATKRPCPYGGESEHFATAEEARTAYEKEQEAHQIFLKAMAKRPGAAEMEAQVIWTRKKRAKLAGAYILNRKPIRHHFKPTELEDLQSYNEAYRAYEADLTEAEKAAIYSYTGITYEPVNRYLQDKDLFISSSDRPEGLPAQIASIEPIIKGMDSALAKAPRQEKRLFRRLDQDTTERFVSSEEWADKLGFTPGAKVPLKAFASTTIDPSYIGRTTQDDQHTSVVLAFESASKGAPAGPTAEGLRGASTQESEREIILPRGLTYEVTAVERASYRHPEYDETEVLTVFLTEVQ